jgi:hypothetical protein
MNVKTTNLDKIIGKHPFNAEIHLKRQLASSFWKDTNDFLWRFGLMKENLPYVSSAFLAKMYVDLLMCSECALKSLIISLSKKPETSEQVYLIARNKSHNLQALYQEVESRAKGRIKLLSKKDKSILLKANSLGVGFRYDITTFLFLSQEDFIDREFNEGHVSSVINYDFLCEFNNTLLGLSKIGNNSLNKYFKNSPISFENLEKLRIRQSTFLLNVKNKL